MNLDECFSVDVEGNGLSAVTGYRQYNIPWEESYAPAIAVFCCTNRGKMVYLS